VPASPGVGVGPAWQLPAGRPEVPAGPAGDPGAERARLDAARDRCRKAIRRTRDAAATSVGEAAAAVFDAHLAFLDDPALLTDARSGIDAGQPAAASWLTAVERVHDVLAGLADPYLRARAADVLAVGDQVLAALVGAAPPEDSLAGASGIVVAGDLTPAQAIGLDPARIAGVVLAGGSPTSHSVMLLRARGVPAVVAAGREVRNIGGGTLVAVDGATGEVAVDPPEEVLARFRTSASASVDIGR
jgi:multiphosphoryl transfer protein